MEHLLQLLQGCAKDDAKCQKEFYDKYLGFVLKISFRYLNTYESAAEAANDSFVKIFKNVWKFEIRDPANIERLLLGWVKRIVINTSIDYMHMELPDWKHKPLQEAAWQDSLPTDNADNKLLYKELIELIKRLSPAYRAVFNLHVIDGYAHHEIAGLLGISIGTSKSNLAKARAFLQKHLIKDDKENVLCFT
ncbi:MAG: sigma-70 family RNA polymerase sigma factor [Bacteroidetes bacterium]|nr:sigma-70 family RNA polymerase sigma factor [Bacteroidota bacterium]MBS1975484.1 sigma-70 family RNA polymerase sigma factor [Bacteroidota bacterium]